MMTRHRHELLVVSTIGLALCLAAPAQAAKASKHNKHAAAATAYTMKHRHSAVAVRPGSRYQGGVLSGPLYNGQDYIGNDPDPNIRSYLIRDMTRYGGPE
jgi:hypothetical protein